MTKMTAAYLGVLVLVTYFSTLVSSDNVTATTPVGNHTGTMDYNSTMQTHAYMSTANGTAPSGAASFTRSGPISILLAVAMAASLVCSRS